MAAVAYRYRVIFEQETNGWYSVHCPALKGVHSQGATYDEAMTNIHEAIAGWLHVAREYGDPIPASDVMEQTLIEVAA
ncbi:MAG: type II toxin-antitoxin system HicB family antitoxin [Chloroflexi bacterium]|nr:type II toxin-antitoxin system HicB family antitoxin [Chloroflexota bacterium]